MRYLCQSGANLQEQNEDGLTALHIATKIGWIPGIQLLFQLGATLIPDKGGNYATHIAAQDGNTEALLLFAKLQKEGNTSIDFRAKNNTGETVIDCCQDVKMKKLIVPKGILGYSFDRCDCLLKTMEKCRWCKSCLMWAMERPGLRFLGQLWVQFIMAWQRYNLYTSSRSRSLSSVISSRESTIQR